MTTTDLIIDAVWVLCLRNKRPATARDIATELHIDVAEIRARWTVLERDANGLEAATVHETRGGMTGARRRTVAVPALRPTWTALIQRCAELT